MSSTSAPQGSRDRISDSASRADWAPVGRPVPGNPGALDGAKLPLSTPLAVRQFKLLNAQRVQARLDQQPRAPSLYAASLRTMLDRSHPVGPYK